MPTVQQVLASNDPVKCGEILLILLAEAASGKEIANTVAEVVQGIFRGKWGPQIKKLAYDLVKACPVSDADAQFVISGMKADVASNIPEQAVQALRFLPHLQPHILATMLEHGDIAVLTKPVINSASGAIRAAGVEALGSVLLIPHVMRAAAQSSGLANQVQEHWQAVTDTLLDDHPEAVAAAAAAACALLAARASLGPQCDQLPEGFLLSRLATITTARVTSALGAVLDSCTRVSSASQVDVARLLLLLVAQTVQEGWWGGVEGNEVPGMPPAALIPSVGALAPAAVAYLMPHVRGADAAARLEASRSVLKIMALVSSPAAVEAAAASAVHFVPHTISMPSSWAGEAMAGLLELEETRHFSEAASEDVLGAAVEGLAVVPPATRGAVLKRLWPALSQLKHAPTRLKLFAAAWAAAVESSSSLEAVGTAEAQAAAALSSVLADSFICRVMTGKLPAAMASQIHAASGVPSTPTRAPSGAGTLAAAAAATAAPHALTASPVMPPAQLERVPSNRSSAPGQTGGADQAKASRSSRPPSSSSGKFLSSLGSMIRRKDSSTSNASGPAAPSAADLQSQASTTSEAASVAGGSAVGDLLSLGAPDARAEARPSISHHQPPALPVVEEDEEDEGAGPSLGGDASPANTQFGALRHELVCALLGVVGQLPGAAAAREMWEEVAGAAAQDKLLEAPSQADGGPQPQRALRVASWLRLARLALQSTAACMLWEPPVVPAITTQISATAAKHAPADFSCAAADAWLQLLQAASLTARALKAVLLQDHAADGISLPLPGDTSQPAALNVSAQGSTAVVLRGTEAEGRELQGLVKQLLREWPSLSRAVRPRALWVISLSLPPPISLTSGPLQGAAFQPAGAPDAPDAEAWDMAVRALHDVLVRAPQAFAGVRGAELLAAAASGKLYQTGRHGWPADRPFVFDVVAASAMCERPDYEVMGFAVGLSTLQHWASVLQDTLASCPPQDAATARRITSDVGALAARLDAVLREAQSLYLDASPVPQLRDWVRRTLRALGVCAVFVSPAVLAEEAAAKAAEDKEDGEEGSDGEGGDRIPTDQDSDAASDYGAPSSETGGGGDLLPISLPTAMYLPPGAPRPQPAIGQSAQFTPPRQQLQPALSVGSSTGGVTPHANGFAKGMELAATNLPGGGLPSLEAFRARAVAAGNTSTSYLVKSGMAASVWGYPFAPGPRATALFGSKRTRRHRTLHAQVQSAIAHLQKEQPGATAAADTQPLSSPAFWDGLSGTSTRLVELSGPGDPVLITGRVSRPAISALAAAGADGAEDAATLNVKLVALNRAGTELRGVTVLVTPHGPAAVEKRGLIWNLPRLSPHDKATHHFVLRLQGYGCVELDVEVQLVSTPVPGKPPALLHCSPLPVSAVTHMLRPPRAGTPPADAFFRLWSALPARFELSAECVWPGREGAASALSAMLRLPLACSLLHFVPMTVSYQAAFAAETVWGEDVLVLVLGQLVPPAPLAGGAPTGSKPAPTRRTTYVDALGDETVGEGVVAPAVPPTAAPAAVFQVLVRSVQPGIVHAITQQPGQWLHDLSGGSLELMGGAATHARVHGGSGMRPALHPRVASLHATFAHGVRALPGPTASIFQGAAGDGKAMGASVGGVHGGPAVSSSDVGGVGGVDVYAQGSLAAAKVSHKWMEAAALAEWQRLVASRG